MTEALPWFMAPQWFVPMFAAVWLAASGLLACISGWVSLAGEYRADEAASGGDTFWFVSGWMGTRFFPVSYSHCLFVTVDAKGFYLSILFPFRFLSPRLYLPWSSFEEVSEGRFLFWRHARMRLRDHWPRINLQGKAGRAALRGYQQWRSAGQSVR